MESEKLAKLEKLIDSVGEYMGKALSIKPPDVGPSLHWSDDSPYARACRGAQESVADVMERELRYIPTKEQLDTIEALMETETFAIQTADLSARMLAESSGGRAFDLHPFTSSPPFLHSQSWELAANGSETIYLGGVAGLLRDVVARMAFAWLRECDRQMMAVHDHAAVGETPKLKALMKTLAGGIAQHATLTKPRDPDGLSALRATPLDPNYLEAQANAEFASSVVDAGRIASSDLRALQNLLTLARDGAETEAAKAVLCDKASVEAMRRVLATPPPELGPREHLDAVGANLNFLSDVLRSSVERRSPTEIRNRLVTRWKELHGGAAWSVLSQAIERLRAFSPAGVPRTLKVITGDADVGRAPLPSMSWCDGPARRWFFVPPPTGPAARSGLSGDGPRIIRLISLVWTLLAHDERAFAEGVVAAALVQNVLCEVHLHADLMCTRIDNERKLCAIGTSMLMVEEDLCDRASLVADDVSKALCSLSNFSLREIYECFRPGSPCLGAMSDRLDAAMRGAMTAPAPPKYAHLCRDGLAVLLPVLEQRRTALGLAEGSPANPLADLLRTLPGVRARLEGNPDEDVVLDVAALKGAHSRLRTMLEQAAGGGLVRALHHTAKGAPRPKARVAYALRRSTLRLLVCVS
jgi:hypothetical protein